LVAVPQIPSRLVSNRLMCGACAQPELTSTLHPGHPSARPLETADEDPAIASCATSPVTVQVELVKRAVVAGRWENAGWVGPLLAVLVLAVAGCSDGAVGGSVGAEESPVKSEPGEESSEVRCGRPFELPAPSGLRLVGRFPQNVPAGQQTVSGIVEVTSREAMRGVAAPAADVFLVREGRVVTTPMAQDAIGVRWELAAGEMRRMPAMASLVSCERDGEPLSPGRYELYARVVLTRDDGTAQRAFGGPWRLRVR
jgi:hypothetical protein